MKILFRVFSQPALERIVDIASVPHAGDRVNVIGKGTNFVMEYRVETVTHIADRGHGDLHVATIDCVAIP